MFTGLIILEDSDVVGLLSLIFYQAGYAAGHVETVTKKIQKSASIDFIILDRPFNLSPDDWDLLKKLKEANERNLPIALTFSPQPSWLQRKSRVVDIDMIFPYPCDLTAEIPKFLVTYFGSQ